MMPPEPNEPAPRFCPGEDYPPYTYIPGQTPHPESDPAGHSFGRRRPASPAIDPARWLDSLAYLRGLDLFNGGYYWESHVEFESLWLAAGRKGASADFLKALIHLAACGVKHLESKPAGIISHARRAAQLFEQVRRSLAPIHPVPFGLPVSHLHDMAMSIEENGWPAVPPKLAPAVGGEQPS